MNFGFCCGFSEYARDQGILNTENVTKYMYTLLVDTSPVYKHNLSRDCRAQQKKKKKLRRR